MEHDSCPFCRGNSYDETLSERRIWATDSYSIYHDKGPIVPGHSLVIPYSHATAMGRVDTTTLKNICVHLKRQMAFNSPNERTIVFEHGILDDETVGCGISHAHWHVVNLIDVDAVRFLGAVQSSAIFIAPLSPADLRECERSYLFVWDVSTEGGSVYDGHKSRSQLLRRILAETQGVSEWDWRQISKITDYA